MESAIVPGIYDATLADHDLRRVHRRGVQMTRRLAAQGGTAGRHLERREPGGRAEAARADRAGDDPAEARPRNCGDHLPRRRRALPVRALLGARPAHGGDPERRGRSPRFARMAARRFRTNAAARCSARTASCRKRSRCRTRPRKGRGGGSSCGRTTTARGEARARRGTRAARVLSLASGSPGASRRSTISITRGRRFPT